MTKCPKMSDEGKAARLRHPAGSKVVANGAIGSVNTGYRTMVRQQRMGFQIFDTHREAVIAAAEWYQDGAVWVDIKFVAASGRFPDEWEVEGGWPDDD